MYHQQVWKSVCMGGGGGGEGGGDVDNGGNLSTL